MSKVILEQNVKCHKAFLFKVHNKYLSKVLSVITASKWKPRFHLSLPNFSFLSRFFFISRMLKAEIWFRFGAMSVWRLVTMAKCNVDEKTTTVPPSTSTSTFFPPNLYRLPGAPTNPLNPGNILNLHKKTRDLTPEWIEGLKLRCAKNLDVHKTLYGEWIMGNNTPAGFRFGGMLCRKDNDSITVNNFF